ncbi:MAG: S8 family serine peptidase, partial [Phycisphaerales bacterium]
MRHRFRHLHLWLVACLVVALLVGCNTTEKSEEKTAAAPKQQAPAKQKIQITKLDDLPQHTYPYTGDVVELVKSKKEILALAHKVKADIESDLDTYDIKDANTLQDKYGTLLTIDLIKGNYQSALKRVDQIRDLEGKEAAKLTTGLTTHSMVAAKRKVGKNAPEDLYRKTFQNEFAKRVNDLPWDVVQDLVQENKGRMEILSENLIIGSIQAGMQPVIDQTGELNADLAASALRIHYLFEEQLPLKNEIIGVYQGFIAANKTEKPNIWAARAIALNKTDNCRSVLIAVWDSGSDPSVFEDQLWTNPKEKPNGQDDDGNGYIDDIHGIAYDIYAERTTGPLCPLGEAAERIPEVMKHMKGLMDLQAAIDSPEATALNQHLANLAPEDVQGFIEDLGLAGNYAHGTHVGGIMVEGNPFARMMIARLSYDHRMVPVARTIDWGKRDGQKCRDTVQYFKDHGVRVVNMSWGEALEDAEDSLEKNGIGNSAEERREMARKVFGFQKEGLYEAIKNAPDILFVCAAGNADSDVEFDDYIASSFDLPNLLVVGAVDQAGD